MLLVSGASSTVRPYITERPDVFGTLAVPGAGNAIPEAGKWAADNGAYSGFDEAAFLAMLQRHRWAKERCIWVAAPDVVADAAATLRLFDIWEPRIREMGYPVALVAQNGLTANRVPWDRIDAIFIGGTTEWKLGPDAALIIRRANWLGKWAHMGRVNSKKRISQAAVTGCDSVDGSGFSKWSKAMLARHAGLLRGLSSQRRIALEELASTPVEHTEDEA